jgi:hypothetical protein
MAISGRTWPQLFLCAVACVAKIHASQSTAHPAAVAIHLLLVRSGEVPAPPADNSVILALTTLPRD